MLHQIISIVQEAGNIITEAFDKPRNVKHKGVIDLVTETDVAVENFLKKALRDVAPGAIFMAEESAEHITEPTQDCWIIDPVDGTTNFVHGFPMVSTSVALWQNGHVAYGVVNAPILHQCFSVKRGEGSYCNGKKIHVSPTDILQNSLIGTGFPYDIHPNVNFVTSGVKHVLPLTRGIRRTACSSLDLCYVAKGIYDAYYEMNLKPWDIAAGMLLVEEAGGCVSNTQGQPYMFGQEILASNGILHEEIRAVLQRRER